MADAPKQKILFMLPKLTAGGAERVLITLMNNLDRARFEPHFLAMDDSGPARAWVDPDIAFHSFDGKNLPRSIFPLIALIKDLRPDTLITTMVHSNALALLMKLVFPKLRVIIRESSLPAVMVKEYGLKGHVGRCIYRFLYPRADLVLSPSRIIPQQFEHDLGLKNINHAVLYNPVDQDKMNAVLQAQSTATWDGNSDRVRFVWLGRLSYEKGLDRLFEALAENPLSINWQLDILGEGAEHAHLQALCTRLGLSNHINFLGYQAQPWPLISAADCLLLPSRWEGMPNVALEALACGTPVIAHIDAGGIVEIAQHAGADNVIVAPDMTAFTTAMNAAARKDPENPRPSRLPDIFSLKTVVKQFEAFLQPDKGDTI